MNNYYKILSYSPSGDFYTQLAGWCSPVSSGYINVRQLNNNHCHAILVLCLLKEIYYSLFAPFITVYGFPAMYTPPNGQCMVCLWQNPPSLPGDIGAVEGRGLNGSGGGESLAFARMTSSSTIVSGDGGVLASLMIRGEIYGCERSY